MTMYLFKPHHLVTVFICLATWTHAARYALLQKHGPVAPRAAWIKQDADLFKTAKSACQVDLPEALLSPARLSRGDELFLNLPDARQALATIDQITTDVMGLTTVRARVADDPFAYLILSTDGSSLLADINLPARKIRRAITTKKGIHYLMEPDAEADPFLEDAAGPTTPQDAPFAPSGMITPAADPGTVTALAGVSDPATIDIMVVYTPAAKTYADAKEGSISNVINQLMAKAQLACDNSQTLITMRLVHVAEVSYTETADAGIDLGRLTATSDGYMDNVHTLRNTYGADLVVLLEFTESTGGIGWVLSSTSGAPAHGFSISRVQQASWSYTTIHEIGHNMGCGHHKLQTTQPGPGLYSYSAGWRWAYNANYYCSVMTYESGSYFADGIYHARVGYFSDPAVLLNGVPTGDATDGNNALTLRQVKHTVAAYRASTVNVVATPAFSPASGTTFAASLLVSISCSTADATIRYTTNGSEPTTNSTLYTAPFTLSTTTTVRAKAFKSGMIDSTTASATYTSIRPPNDLFDHAIALSGASGSTTGTNVDATKETGEPSHAMIATATNSVWWTWTAPSTGVLRVDTLRTSFDTVLAAYTGPSVNALTVLSSNDDFRYADNVYQSLISFTVKSNMTYYLAVAGYNGANGTITLDWLFVPDNALTTLQNGIPVTAAGVRYSTSHFKIAVPSGASNLVITTAGGLIGQDCDMFVLPGAPATLDLYDYYSDLIGNAEQVSVATPSPGDWYIMLYGYSAYSGVTLKASYAQNSPVITSAHLTGSSSATNLVIQFDGNAGRTYNIQRKDALTDLTWTTIGTHTPTANKLTTLQITVTPGKPSGFYRLQMQ